MEYANEAQVTEKIGLLQGAETNVAIKQYQVGGNYKNIMKVDGKKKKQNFKCTLNIKFFCVGRKDLHRENKNCILYTAPERLEKLYTCSLFRAF